MRSFETYLAHNFVKQSCSPAPVPQGACLHQHLVEVGWIVVVEWASAYVPACVDWACVVEMLVDSSWVVVESPGGEKQKLQQE